MIKRQLIVVGQVAFHFFALLMLNHFYQVRATEYLLWIVLVELTFLNYDFKNSK